LHESLTRYYDLTIFILILNGRRSAANARASLKGKLDRHWVSCA
jgi:phage gp37-like protein